MAPTNAIDMTLLRELSVVKLNNIDPSREDRDGLRRFVLIKSLLCDNLVASEEPLEYTEEDVRLGEEIWLDDVLDGLSQEEDEDGYVCISRPTTATTVMGEEVPLPSSSSEETTTITTDGDQTTITTITTITTPIVNPTADDRWLQTPQLRPSRNEDVFYREDDFTDLDDSIRGGWRDTRTNGGDHNHMVICEGANDIDDGEDHNHMVIRRGVNNIDDDEEDDDDDYSPPSSPLSSTIRVQGQFFAPSEDLPGRPRFHRYPGLLPAAHNVSAPHQRYVQPIVVAHAANDLSVPYATAFADAGLLGWCDEKAAGRIDPFPTPRNERSPVLCTDPSSMWFV